MMKVYFFLFLRENEIFSYFLKFLQDKNWKTNEYEIYPIYLLKFQIYFFLISSINWCETDLRGRENFTCQLRLISMIKN